MSRSTNYALVQEGQPWAQARESCQAMGGDLATMTSISTQRRLMEFVAKRFTRDFWIGAEGRQGAWKWVSGEPVSDALKWTDESHPEPTGCFVLHGGSDYTGAFADKYPGFTWHPCSGVRPYLCELNN